MYLNISGTFLHITDIDAFLVDMVTTTIVAGLNRELLLSSVGMCEGVCVRMCEGVCVRVYEGV